MKITADIAIVVFRALFEVGVNPIKFLDNPLGQCFIESYLEDEISLRELTHNAKKLTLLNPGLKYEG